MHKICIRMLVIVLISVVQIRAEDFDGLLNEGVVLFKQGCKVWQLDPLLQSSAKLAAATQAKPEATNAWYWRAAAEMHVALYGMDTGTTNCPAKTITEYVERAIASATKLVELDPATKEGYALLSVSTGLKIADSPSTIMWNGLKVAKLNKKAIANGTDNPRAQYLVGTTIFNGSGVLGGKDTALQHFKEAEKLFDLERKTEPASILEPRWGYSGTLEYIAKTCLALKKQDEARTYFKKCLEVDPGNTTAINGLAELEK